VNSAPATYSLQTTDVHIWTVPLISTDAALGALPPLLSPSEHERAERFVFENDRARYISCRATLRLLLSRYTALPPEKINFHYENYGKPSIPGGWQFNVSHSRDLAAIAISRFHPVGIDLERIDPLFPRDEVAAEILDPVELRDLTALPATKQPDRFFQLWTLKEALLKAVGGGFSLDPRAIRIRMDADPAIVAAPPEFQRATLHQLTLRDGYAAALAILSRDARPQLFEF